MESTDSEYLETDSDGLEEELEQELYSVLHYNVLSDDIPFNVSGKYDIKLNGQNEFLISFKRDKGEKEPIEENVVYSKNICIQQHNVEIQNVITISDEDSASDVLNEPTIDLIEISSPSVVEISDSSSPIEMENDMMLNIDNPGLSTRFPIDDTDDEGSKVEDNWKEVVSPRTWTKGMKKYYNRPCKELKNFDCEKIREEMKGKGDWHINFADRFPSKMKLKRCTICRKTDHLRKDCTRRFLSCHMCGNSGHSDRYCPYRKCLNCGRKNDVFVAMCKICIKETFQTCSECKQKGHSKYNCPDLWRRYHSTTKGELVVKKETLNEKLMCCNCAQSGHLYEHCTKLYWSPYPPTSSLIKTTEEPVPTVPRGKRSRSRETHSFDFVHTPKRPKKNHFMMTSTSYNQPSTSFTPAPTPLRMPKRYKKKRYFHNSVNNIPNRSNHLQNNNEINSPKQTKRKKKKKVSPPLRTI